MLPAMKAGGSALATERVRQRLAEWVKQTGHGAQRRLAKAVGAYFGESSRSDQWISDILSGRNDPTLHDLDAFADAMDIPPGELVRFPDKAYAELTMAELIVVEAFRAVSFTAQQHIVSVLRALIGKSGRISPRPQNLVAQPYGADVKQTSLQVKGGSSSNGHSRPTISESPALDASLSVPELHRRITDVAHELRRLTALLDRALASDAGPHRAGTSDGTTGAGARAGSLSRRRPKK